VELKALRQAVIRGFSGESPIKMEVVSVPINEEVTAAYQSKIERIATALEQSVLSTK
jgi:hypothetical protein